jgi:hypothetical protein
VETKKQAVIESFILFANVSDKNKQVQFRNATSEETTGRKLMADADDAGQERW